MEATAKKVSGPFPTLPGQLVVDEFLDWVKLTGQPDLWRHHDPTTPPPDEDFVERIRFEVPEKLKAKVGEATCPICSPNHPKYFKGALCWFPQSGTMRAIGGDCATAHFGVERYNRAVAAGKLVERRQNAQDFLLAELPRVAALRKEVELLRSTAGDVDEMQRTLVARTSRAACEKLAKLGAEGSLSIEAHTTIQAVDAYGKGQSRVASRLVATVRVDAMDFLKKQKVGAVVVADQTLQALSKIDAMDEEEALEFVAETLVRDDDLWQAETLARAAVKEYDRLKGMVDLAKRFFSPPNLAALSQWTRDSRVDAPMIFHFKAERPNQLLVRLPQRTQTTYPMIIPRSLR